MNSTVLPYFHFGMNHQCFAAARPTCTEYVDGRKRENSYFWKDCIIVATTCSHSVQFGCYVTWKYLIKRSKVAENEEDHNYDGGDLCEENSEKGGGWRKVVRKDQQGPMETNYNSSRTAGCQVGQPNPYKSESRGRTRTGKWNVMNWIEYCLYATPKEGKSTVILMQSSTVGKRDIIHILSQWYRLIDWLFIREYINNVRPTGATRGRINCGSTILITINKKY